MKLDLDLVREILLLAEGAPPNVAVGSISVPGYDQDTVLEHLELLHERRLIEAHLLRAGHQRVAGAVVERLTWEGHAFLGDARNDEVWSRTKEIVKDKGGSASFEVVKALLSKVALNLFGLE